MGKVGIVTSPVLEASASSAMKPYLLAVAAAPLFGTLVGALFMPEEAAQQTRVSGFLLRNSCSFSFSKPQDGKPTMYQRFHVF